jgi:hypothetical protein
MIVAVGTVGSSFREFDTDSFKHPGTPASCQQPHVRRSSILIRLLTGYGLTKADTCLLLSAWRKS